MRLAHDYVVADAAQEPRAGLDRDAADFADRMGYAAGRFNTREELIAAGEEEWARELHAVLRELLVPERRTLSVGSGYGEHEVQLALAGHRMVATDIVEEALADAARLFPELETRRFDVLEPDRDERFEDILVASLDYALDDALLERALRNCRELLAPGGRVILVQRYRDTPGTWLIDRVLLPLVAVASRARGTNVVRREHGFRRSGRELKALVRRCGFRIGRVRSAGFAMELTRIDLRRRAPGLYRLVQRADRRVRLFNNCTVFELIP
jgi:SAM-dependent methyltransferase